MITMNKFEKISERQFFIDFAEYLDEECLDTRDAKAIYNMIKLPKRATTGSAGHDFFAPYDITIPPKGTVKVPTGIRVCLDDDKFLAIYPRSGLGFKYKMQLYNGTGIIDSDYIFSDNEGHIWCKFYNDSPEGKTITIKQGEAMCQGIIQQFFKTIDDETDGIRNGGMGSTTK
jgi:dUTP pyrophosphatase